jgi:hypothetical protein
MKRFKLLIIVLVFSFISNLFVFRVNASSTININKGLSSINILNANICNLYTNNGSGSWWSYYCDTGYVNVSLTDLTNNLSYSYSKDLSNGAWLYLNGSSVSSITDSEVNISGSTLPGLVLNHQYAITVDWSEVANYNGLLGATINVSVKGTYKFTATTLNGVVSVSDTASKFSLVYNNDYNYTSNKASFTMQYSNFTFNYFSLLNTDATQNGGFGGFHLLNYTINNNIVNCTFDNTYETMSNPHYLFFTVHGLDYFGNPIDLSGSINFNINVNTTPSVKNYKVSYVMDGSPCIAGSGGGRVYLYIDYGSGYVLQDTSKWSLTISQVANGGQDTFTYGIDPNFNTAYKISITKIDDIDTYNYDIYVNDTAKHLTGQLKVCSNDDYIFDASGSQTSGQETDIFTLLQEIKDIFVGLWNLVLSIVDFFGALLIAIFSIAYSMGVAVISLLKIVVDFVASVSTVLFNRNTNYYSLVNVMTLPSSFTYQGKVIALSGVWGVVDNQLKYIHDNIIIQYSGIWAVISLIYLIRKHILIEKVEDEDNE